MDSSRIATPSANNNAILTHVSLPSADYGKQKQYNIIHALNISRPQLTFQDKVDNSSHPQLPKLTFPKPNCSCSEEFKLQVGINPYQKELETFSYPSWVFKMEKETVFSPLESTPLTFINDELQFDFFISKISSEVAIAVDLEHHNYRSFEGFVCLMQVSTRTEDFIIDTLACRSFIYKLNGIFSNPSILKVFHGAESDIIWLQRDFGVYVVGMFDTYYASKLLNLGSHSLSHLIRYYVGIEVDKKFQLADWRIRPLPQEMIDYARGDTHYLLYICDRMRGQLLELGKSGMSFLKQVLTSSTKRCGQVYCKPDFDQISWRRLVDKYNKKLTNQQVAVLKGILEWRDAIARLEDESLHYVMPRMMIMRIAEFMPTSVQKIMRCFHPCPPLVKQRAHDLLLVIKGSLKEFKDVPENDKEEEMKNSTHLIFDDDTEIVEDMFEMDDNVDTNLSAVENSNTFQIVNTTAIVDTVVNVNAVDIVSCKTTEKKGNAVIEKPGMEIDTSVFMENSNTSSVESSKINPEKKPQISIFNPTVKKSVFDDDEAPRNEAPITLSLFSSISSSSTTQQDKFSVCSDQQKQVTSGEANGQNIIPLESPNPKLKSPSDFSSISDHIELPPSTSVVKFAKNPLESQDVNVDFIRALKKPKQPAKVSVELPESSVDFCKEYQQSLNLAKSLPKSPDFDPNQQASGVPTKRMSKKKFSNSQKSHTYIPDKKK